MLKKFKFNNNDLGCVEKYIIENSDKPIYVVYNEIKKKKLKERSRAEILVFTYLSLNKKRFGIRD